MTTIHLQSDRRLPVAKSLVTFEAVLMSVTTLEATALSILGMASPLPAVVTGVLAIALFVIAGRGTLTPLPRTPQWILLAWGLVDGAIAWWIAHAPPPVTVLLARVVLPGLVLALSGRSGRR